MKFRNYQPMTIDINWNNELPVSLFPEVNRRHGESTEEEQLNPNKDSSQDVGHCYDRPCDPAEPNDLFQRSQNRDQDGWRRELVTDLPVCFLVN